MNHIVLSKLSLIALGLLLLFIFYTKIFSFLMILLPFWLGYLISKPLSYLTYHMKAKAKIPESISAVILIILLLGIGGTAIFKLVVWAGLGIQKLMPLVPGWIEEIQGYGQNVLSVIEKAYFDLPDSYAGILSNSLSSLIESLSGVASKAVQTSLLALLSVPKFFIGFLVVIISTYFFTADHVRIERLFQPFIQRYIKQNKFFQTFKRDVMMVAVGYLKAQLTLMTITFSVSLAGLLILGFPRALPIALGIGLVDVIPALGPATVYLPWAISKLILSDVPSAVKLFALYGIVTVTRQLLEAKVVGHHIGIHPLITLISLYLGVRFLGLSGILLGPLTAITILAYYKNYAPPQKDEH